MSPFQSDKIEMLSAMMLTLSTFKYCVNLQLQDHLYSFVFDLSSLFV